MRKNIQIGFLFLVCIVSAGCSKNYGHPGDRFLKTSVQESLAVDVIDKSENLCVISIKVLRENFSVKESHLHIFPKDGLFERQIVVNNKMERVFFLCGGRGVEIFVNNRRLKK